MFSGRIPFERKRSRGTRPATLKSATPVTRLHQPLRQGLAEPLFRPVYLDPERRLPVLLRKAA